LNSLFFSFSTLLCFPALGGAVLALALTFEASDFVIGNSLDTGIDSDAGFSDWADATLPAGNSQVKLAATITNMFAFLCWKWSITFLPFCWKHVQRSPFKPQFHKGLTLIANWSLSPVSKRLDMELLTVNQSLSPCLRPALGLSNDYREPTVPAGLPGRASGE
jgi:hypothetical protein